jgi:hypothetical protein
LKKENEGEEFMLHKGEGIPTMDDRNMVGIASPHRANGKFFPSFQSVTNEMNSSFFSQFN